MMNQLQQYLVYEYVADYRAGHLSRRDLVRRVLNITGGLGSAATLLLALGCSTPAAQPTTAPAATAAPNPTTAPPPSPATAARPAAAAGPGGRASPAASPPAAASASPSAAAH